jgi:type II secretory pathway component GspD/PulD (secretin)
VVTLKEAASSPVTDGITIDVTPHITNDGYVSIELAASDENATLQDFTSGSGPNAVRISLPQKASTKVTTNIMVADGQTAVIGGILKNKVTEDERSVPGINRIPILSFFFKKTSDSVEQRNLTMFITPHVIPNNEKDVMAEESARLSERISGIQQRPSAAQQEQSRSLKE